uniref:Uncharacterized protein n=1 Tax=Anguilla anguilla TaxID=7936 RepID=A0A0E9PXS5_ANGAN
MHCIHCPPGVAIWMKWY